MGSDWFKHDFDADSDPKMLALRSSEGWEGAGKYWYLVSQMARNETHSCPKSSLKILATVMGETKKSLKRFLSVCVKVGLFSEDESSYWSPSLRRRLDAYDEKRSKIKAAAIKREEDKRSSKESTVVVSGEHNRGTEKPQSCGIYSTSNLILSSISISEGGLGETAPKPPLGTQTIEPQGPDEVVFAPGFRLSAMDYETVKMEFSRAKLPEAAIRRAFVFVEKNHATHPGKPRGLFRHDLVTFGLQQCLVEKTQRANAKAAEERLKNVNKKNHDNVRRTQNTAVLERPIQRGPIDIDPRVAALISGIK